MGNKNIAEKIGSEYAATKKYPSDEVWKRLESSINTTEMTVSTKKSKKSHRFSAKSILAAVVLVIILATATTALAPLILKMLGSDIAFFASDKQTRYSADYELIKQYSSEVGLSATRDGFGLTVDNIAFDGTFMYVFYTIKSEINLYEESKERSESWGSSRFSRFDESYAREAMVFNRVDLEIANHELLDDPYSFVMSDGYFVSDYELKAVNRYIITDDLPDMFDINVIYRQYNGRVEFWPTLNDDGTFDMLGMPVPISINLTIDMSESKIEKLTASKTLSATVTNARRFNYDEYIDERARRVAAGDIEEGEDISDVSFETIAVEVPDFVEHNIKIDRVSLSPLGNIIVITELGAENIANKELLTFYILDDKGNFYGKLQGDYLESRGNQQEDNTRIIEFYGDVPLDAQYLKLVPYNSRQFGWKNPDASDAVSLVNGSLPARLKYSDHGDVIIESYAASGNELAITYKFDGMAGDYMPPSLIGISARESLGICSWTAHIYDRQTDSYTMTFTYENPIENPDGLMNHIGIHRRDIELLEDQAIVIPLRGESCEK